MLLKMVHHKIRLYYHIEYDNTTSKLRAIATGSAEVKSTDLLKECDEDEAKSIASKDMNTPLEDTTLIEKTKNFFIFRGGEKIRILDKKGFIKVQRSKGMAKKCKAKEYREVVKDIYEKLTVYKDDSVLRPDFYICSGAKVMDFDSCTELNQNLMLMELIVQEVEENEDIVVVGVKNEI